MKKGGRHVLQTACLAMSLDLMRGRKMMATFACTDKKYQSQDCMLAVYMEKLKDETDISSENIKGNMTFP